MGFILRLLCCTAAGLGCGFAAGLWIRRLERQRHLEHRLSEKADRLLPVVTALLGAVIGAVTTGFIMPVYALLLLCVCTVVAVMDWCHRVIPNPAVLAVFALKLLFGIPALLGVPGFPEWSIVQSLIGLVACFVVFSLPGFLGKNVGAGDIKLAAAMGFLLGIYEALAAVVIMGLLILGYVMVQHRIPMLQFLKTNIPMGPFIAVGMLAVLLGSRFLL